MPVYKDKQRGTWYAKYSYTDKVTGKRKQIMKRGFSTKRDGQLWLASQLTTEKATSITLWDLSQKYYDYRQPKEATRKDQEAMLLTYVPFINYPVEQITKKLVVEWYIEFTRGDLSPGTINLLIRVLRSIFKFGSEYYDLQNPSVGLKQVRNPKKPYQTWTPEEFNRFVECVDGYHYKNIFTFLFWTGCRRSEALALQYTDFKDGTVHIHQQVSKAGTLSDLKTDSSDRTLKLAPALQSYLQPVLGECSEERPFVFGGDRWLSKATLQGRFVQGIDKSGVKRIRIHDLRHSFATMMIGSGANIVSVSKYLGHKTIDQTLKTYTHLFEKADEEMIDKIDLIIKNG